MFKENCQIFKVVTNVVGYILLLNPKLKLTLQFWVKESLLVINYKPIKAA